MRDRLVGHAHVQRAAVGLGEHGDGGDAQLAAGADHAARDLAAVGDQDLANATGGHAISIPQVRPRCAVLRRPRARGRCARWRWRRRCAGSPHLLPALLQTLAHVDDDVRLDAQHLGHPLVVHARRRHRRLHVQLPKSSTLSSTCVVAVMIVGPPAAPDGHLHAIAVEHDGRRHRRQRALARRDRILRAADQPERVGHARLQREVVHLIVEQDAGLARDQLGAEAQVDGRGQRHRVALGVDDAQVGGAAVAVQGRPARPACRSCRAAARASSLMRAASSR